MSEGRLAPCGCVGCLLVSVWRLAGDHGCNPMADHCYRYFHCRWVIFAFWVAVVAVVVAVASLLAVVVVVLVVVVVAVVVVFV